MRNEILEALHEGYKCSPRIVNFNTSLKSFLDAFGGIFEVDNLTPGLAKDYYKTFLIDYRERKRNESSIQIEEPKVHIPTAPEKQDSNYVCKCGAIFETHQAHNGHKKKCKL